MLLCWLTASVHGSDWYPYPVELSEFGEPVGGQAKLEVDYKPLAKASKYWKLCVSFPHMKDSYWMAVNFGVVNEVKRQGVQMRLYQAGGYDQLDNQIDQIRRCVAEGAEGVIIGAISFDGLNDLVGEIRDQGVPVIDVINGISSPRVSARSLVSFEEMAYRAAEYIARRHPPGSPEVKVAWFPGPKGAGWVQAGEAGFKKAIAGGAISLVATRYGDTGKQVQRALVEEVLQAHPDIDYVVGTAVTAAAAVKVLRRQGLSARIKVVSYYFTPEIYRGIKRKWILAAPTDSAVIQGRIAVDQVVRLLEGRPLYRFVGPKIYLIDQSNIDTFERLTSLAPSGFRATYSANIRMRK